MCMKKIITLAKIVKLKTSMPGIKTLLELYLYQSKKGYRPYLFTTIIVVFSLFCFVFFFFLFSFSP